MDKAALEDLFAPWAEVSVKRMFSGLGIWRDSLMFALVVDGTLYFKAGEATREAFEAAGGRPFLYRGRDRQVSLGYFTPPAAIFDDEEALREWAERAFAAARAAAGLRRPRARRG